MEFYACIAMHCFLTLAILYLNCYALLLSHEKFMFELLCIASYVWVFYIVHNIVSILSFMYFVITQLALLLHKYDDQILAILIFHTVV